MDRTCPGGRTEWPGDRRRSSDTSIRLEFKDPEPGAPPPTIRGRLTSTSTRLRGGTTIFSIGSDEVFRPDDDFPGRRVRDLEDDRLPEFLHRPRDEGGLASNHASAARAASNPETVGSRSRPRRTASSRGSWARRRRAGRQRTPGILHRRHQRSQISAATPGLEDSIRAMPVSIPSRSRSPRGRDARRSDAEVGGGGRRPRASPDRPPEPLHRVVERRVGIPTERIEQLEPGIEGRHGVEPFRGQVDQHPISPSTSTGTRTRASALPGGVSPRARPPCRIETGAIGAVHRSVSTTLGTIQQSSASTVRSPIETSSDAGHESSMSVPTSGTSRSPPRTATPGCSPRRCPHCRGDRAAWRRQPRAVRAPGRRERPKPPARPFQTDATARKSDEDSDDPLRSMAVPMMTSGDTTPWRRLDGTFAGGSCSTASRSPASHSRREWGSRGNADGASR